MARLLKRLVRDDKARAHISNEGVRITPLVAEENPAYAKWQRSVERARLQP
jgi:hypothetical protein